MTSDIRKNPKNLPLWIFSYPKATHHCTSQNGHLRRDVSTAGISRERSQIQGMPCLSMYLAERLLSCGPAQIGLKWGHQQAWHEWQRDPKTYPWLELVKTVLGSISVLKWGLANNFSFFVQVYLVLLCFAFLCFADNVFFNTVKVCFNPVLSDDG